MPKSDSGASLNIERFDQLLLESAAVGLAIADPKTLEITFHNRRFGEWFPEIAEGGLRLTTAIPTIDPEKMRERLASDRPYRVESELKIRHRTVTLAVQVAAHTQEGVGLLVVEAQNVSKIKELEYMVESYSRMVEKHNRELRKEKERVERLLLNIMPKNVYDEWKTFGVTTPQRYDNAVVLMLDFVGFTDMAVSRDPTALIGELNDIFTTFDRIVEQFGCERIKTIGDAYLAVAGIPDESPDDARNLANVALRFVHYLRRRNQTHEHQWLGRIGLHAGPVIGSIVGIQEYVYDIFGPGVNLAARMEAFARPMAVAVSEDFYRLVRADFSFQDLGDHEIKGFGTKRIYKLEGTDELRIAAEAELTVAELFD
jgi:adenylate cyclase